MSHFGDFMDGVPVKISEKYKRPPRIDLPYSVVECPSRARAAIDGANYCYTFENNVLVKLKELRSAKETRKNERRHRLQLLEEAKQKKLDLIAAAEAEERLKQLSVSEVSYPSTDEISELPPDDRVHATCNATSPTHALPPLTEIKNHCQENGEQTICSADTEMDPNILQPIQVMSNIQPNNLLDDPDPLQGLRMMRVSQYNTSYSKHNIDNLTFSDFENDTSSPFDNIELKTINDMELLAQVLQSQRESATSCPAPPPQPAPGYAPAYMQAPDPQMYATQQPYPVSNGYYVPAESGNVYMQNYQYYAPPSQYQPVDPAPYCAPVPDDPAQVPNDEYIPQTYYYNFPQLPVQYPPASAYNSVADAQNPPDCVIPNPSMSSAGTMKSRSRSVPDIVNEIKEELASAKLRASERSYNVSPAPEEVAPRPSSSYRKSHEKKKRKQELLPNPYDKLPPQLQSMCNTIHSMGFPLDRVARVCTLVGDNDKKVIEGVLIVGELMDLGFSEGAVSAALAKHRFNRDGALDDLLA